MPAYAKIEYSNRSNCFVQVASVGVKSGDNLKVILLESEGRKHYLSVSGTCSGEKVIKIHGKFGNALKLKDGEAVVYHFLEDAGPKVTSAKVSCCSEDDWEILESNATFVSNNLLNQLRIVYPGLVFPFWLSKSMFLFLKIDEITPPNDYGLLSPNTEIIIPDLSPTPVILPQLKSHKKLRIHPISIPSSVSLLPTETLLLTNAFHGFTYKSHLQIKSDTNLESITVQIIPNEGEPSKPIKLFMLDSISETAREYLPFTNIPSVFLHAEIRQGLSVGEWVWVKVVEEKDQPIFTKASFKKTENAQDCREMIGFHEIKEDCESFIKASLNLSQREFENASGGGGSLLIYGSPGSGKTTLAKAIAESLSKPPFYISWDLINCAKLHGKKAENVEKEITKVMQILGRKHPSILILDDFDVLTTTQQDQEKSKLEEFVQFKMNETLLETLMRGQGVSLICTSSSLEVMNGYWQSRPGFHFFQKIVKVAPLSKEERLELFKSSVKHYYQTGNDSHKDADCELSEIGIALGSLHELNGTPRFVINVGKKWASMRDIAHVPSSGWASSENIITKRDNKDVSEELKRFNEIVAEEIRFCGWGELKKAVGWESLGGLWSVKGELKKILEWPIKFPQLFKNAPVRLPCGILFYGYPGTGKTLLGLATQTVANVKFIHVKGPELLSKYIGASEQAVQDVFARARDSRPSILFFDEFDSLVPRRGHDSSGVTDRVVNQFLSEMDGIDGGLGEGVYLIAASSRPDLIDPAVLRPGRLDKHLFFDFPSEGERMEILKIISGRVSLELEEEEWAELAKRTEGFTGADLNSLVFTAQLDVVHKYLESEMAASPDSSQEKMTKDGLLKAITNFKPSLDGKELRKFRAIYETFKSGAGAAEAREAGKRATLA